MNVGPMPQRVVFLTIGLGELADLGVIPPLAIVVLGFILLLRGFRGTR